MSNREALESRRRQLQVKLAVTEHVRQRIEPILEVLDHLCEKGIAYRVVSIGNIPAGGLPYFKEAMAVDPYTDYALADAELLTEQEALAFGKLFEVFPSINAFHYVPDLPCYAHYDVPVPNPREGLPRAVAELGLPDQPVHFYYLRYALLLEVNLHDLLAQDNDVLFNSWHGDVAIFPADFGWVLAFTLEEEWYGGRK